MGLRSRVVLLLRGKGLSVPGRAEDVRRILDDGYEQQQDLLRTVKQGLIEVAVSKRQFTQQVQRLRARLSQMEDETRGTFAAGGGDVAQRALERTQTVLVELAKIEEQAAEVAEQQRTLTLAEQRLSMRIEGFRVRRESLATRCTATEAQARVNEALSEVAMDVMDLSRTRGQVEHTIGRLLARASAVDALLETGEPALSAGEAD